MDSTSLPAGPPPPGVIPNFAHPESWGHITIGVVATTIVITVVGVAIRVFTKLRIMRQFDAEDYFLVIGLFWFLAFAAINLWPSQRGFEHMWERPLASVPTFLWVTYIATIMNVLAIVFAKWAVLLQLQRVFAVKRNSAIWWAVRMVITLDTLFYFIGGFITIFLCTPREKIWNPTIPGRCIISLSGADLVATIANIIVNCGILAIPVMGLWTLKINLRQKIIVGSMFSVSLLSLLASIARIVTSVRLLHSTDPTRDTAPEAYLTIFELLFFILATVIPTMPRFWQWCRGRDESQQRPSLAAFARRDTSFGTATKATMHGGRSARQYEITGSASNIPLHPQGSRTFEGVMLRTVDIDIYHTDRV